MDATDDPILKFWNAEVISTHRKLQPAIQGVRSIPHAIKTKRKRMKQQYLTTLPALRRCVDPCAVMERYPR
jgi:hypothetical protein